jgi:hypothetical protein
MASNSDMIDELEAIWKESAWSGCCTGICLKGFRRTRKCFLSPVSQLRFEPGTPKIRFHGVASAIFCSCTESGCSRMCSEQDS